VSIIRDLEATKTTKKMEKQNSQLQVSTIKKLKKKVTNRNQYH
jgi:hypothetical protein